MLCRFPGLELWKCRICILWHHRVTRSQREPKWTFLVLLKTKLWTSNERNARIRSSAQWTPIMTARAWRYCTEVLAVYIRSVFLSLPLLCMALAALSSGSILRRGVWTNVGWKQCCRIDWFGVERLHVHNLVRWYIMSVVVVVVPALHVPFVFLLSTWSLLSCMIVQVPRRKESIPSCALPSQNVCLLGPPVRHRRNSSLVHYEVRLALLGMQHRRMVMQDHLSTPHCCYL